MAFLTSAPALWHPRNVDVPTDRTGPDGLEPALAALVAELGRRTGVCWLRYADEDGSEHRRAAWHVWYDDALHLVAGGTEQQLPGIEAAGRVEVTMRSKESHGRLVTWVGEVEVLAADDERRPGAVEALLAERLNLPDIAEAREAWRRQSVVVRVTPTGEVLETPDALDDSAHEAPPAPTPATTRGPLPRVLHRRARRRRPLS